MANVEVSPQTPTSSRGRGRGRGRAARGRGRGGQRVNEPGQTSPGVSRNGAFGARLTGSASHSQEQTTTTSEPRPQTKQRRESIGPEDSEVCFICASPISYIGIFQCQHQTCHICALRMRSLYKTRACAHCRTESPYVIFTTKDSTERKFEDYRLEDFAQVDHNLGIKYEKNEIFEDTVLLLRYNCPDNDCDAACLGWPDLHRHVKQKHNKVMCDLCTRNKKVFTHEHVLFTVSELKKHEKHGDDNPGAVDQSGFLGHPLCGFCNSRWYGDDELYTHCRERHERCIFCDRRSGGSRPQYFRDYAALEKHFEAEHFVCLDAECQANKTNVFESEMDLKAHQLEQHPNGLSKDARRDARLINLSGFDQLRTPYSQPSSRGARREREGRGRGRDPNAEPLPVSSAQPQSRAELAFQRQMAIQSSQSVAPRTFGGQLSQTPRTQQQNTSPRPVPASLVQAIDDLNIDPSTMNPQERARHLRHQAVTTRAAALLRNSPAKLDQFRKNVSSFRGGTLTAPDLINSFFALFDCPSSELGKLVRELADLYEEEEKRQSLLSAWSSFRSSQDNEDYPSLPGPSSSTLPGPSSAGAGSYSGAISSQSSANLAAVLGANVASGRRVLKLKSSTAQSRNAASSGAAARALNPEAFPALSTTMSTRTRGAPPIWNGSAQPTTNTKLTFAPPPAATVPRNNNQAALPPTMSQRQNQELFPSLPKTAKPNLMISGFNTRGSGRLSGHNSGTNTPKQSAWGASPTPGEAQAALDAVASARNGVDEPVTETTKGKKGKNKKGQTLNLREYLGS